MFPLLLVLQDLFRLRMCRLWELETKQKTARCLQPRKRVWNSTTESILLTYHLLWYSSWIFWKAIALALEIVSLYWVYFLRPFSLIQNQAKVYLSLPGEPQTCGSSEGFSKFLLEILVDLQSQVIFGSLRREIAFYPFK